MIVLTWDEVHALAGQCADEVSGRTFKPDCVIGITMGGVIPAAMIAEQFKTRNFITISAESYHNKEQGELKITYLPTIDLAGKKILLVDEIADSGATMKKIVEILQKEYKPKEIVTVALVVNSDNCTFRPDVFATEVREWVHFPWETN